MVPVANWQFVAKGGTGASVGGIGSSLVKGVNWIGVGGGSSARAARGPAIFPSAAAPATPNPSLTRSRREKRIALPKALMVFLPSPERFANDIPPRRRK